MNRFLFVACAVIVFAGVAAFAQPVGETEREVARLKRAVKVAGQNTDAVDARLQPLQKGIVNLEEKLKSIDPPQLKSEAAEKVELKSVEIPKQSGGPMSEPSKKSDDKEIWRLPLVRESDKKTNLLVVCRDKKVYFADFEALNKAIGKEVVPANKTYFLMSGDYDVKFTPFLVEAVLKAGRTGETAEQIKSPDSALMKRYAKLPAADNIIQMAVYPDSYEVFQVVRKITYEKKYEVGWIPKAVAEEILLGGGKASGQ